MTNVKIAKFKKTMNWGIMHIPKGSLGFLSEAKVSRNPESSVSALTDRTTEFSIISLFERNKKSCPRLHWKGNHKLKIFPWTANTYYRMYRYVWAYLECLKGNDKCIWWMLEKACKWYYCMVSIYSFAIQIDSHLQVNTTGVHFAQSRQTGNSSSERHSIWRTCDLIGFDHIH